MRGYSHNQVFSPFARDKWATATEMVTLVPERVTTPGSVEQLVRCHELARAVAWLINNGGDVQVVDGHYCAVEHTWLVLSPNRGHAECILDVYSVGRSPMVQLVDVKSVSHVHFGLYREGARRDDIKKKVIDELSRYMTHRCAICRKLIVLTNGPNYCASCEKNLNLTTM